MIRATAVLGVGDCLRSFKARGHADAGDRGYDIICAAFSVLVRTAYETLKALPGLELKGSAAERGNLSFRVLKGADSAERAAGVADFLVVGIGGLARDYPDAVEFVIERDWRE